MKGGCMFHRCGWSGGGGDRPGGKERMESLLLLLAPRAARQVQRCSHCAEQYGCSLKAKNRFLFQSYYDVFERM